MYRYEPKHKKTVEKRLTFGLYFVGFLCFLLSQIPALRFPALLQIVGLFLLTGATLILIQYLLRDYAYCVEEGDREVPDLTVTEYYGRRITVVCRVAITDVEAITPITKETREQVKRITKGKRVYVYTSEIFPADLCLLTVRMEDDDPFYVKISADKDLIKVIMNR